MALDPSDLLEAPFSFGECESKELVVSAKCDAWETPEHAVILFMRKRGDFVEIILPELLYKSKKTGDREIIEIPLGLSEEEMKTWYGEYPVSKQFGGFGMNGCELNSDDLTNEVCSCSILLSYDGTIYISPSDDIFGFSPSSEGDQIGLFSSSISFIPNETEPLEEEPLAKARKINK